MFWLFVSLLFSISFTVFVNASKAVCSSGIPASLASGFKNYQPAQGYCSSSFPVAISTIDRFFPPTTVLTTKIVSTATVVADTTTVTETASATTAISTELDTLTIIKTNTITRTSTYVETKTTTTTVINKSTVTQTITHNWNATAIVPRNATTWTTLTTYRNVNTTQTVATLTATITPNAAKLSNKRRGLAEDQIFTSLLAQPNNATVNLASVCACMGKTSKSTRSITSTITRTVPSTSTDFVTLTQTSTITPIVNSILTAWTTSASSISTLTTFLVDSTTFITMVETSTTTLMETTTLDVTSTLTTFQTSTETDAAIVTSIFVNTIPATFYQNITVTATPTTTSSTTSSSTTTTTSSPTPYCKYPPANVPQPISSQQCLYGVPTFAIQIDDCSNPLNGHYAVLDDSPQGAAMSVLYFDDLHTSTPTKFYLSEGINGQLTIESYGLILTVTPNYLQGQWPLSRHPPANPNSFTCWNASGTLSCYSVSEQIVHTMAVCQQNNQGHTVWGLGIAAPEGISPGSLMSDYYAQGICLPVANFKMVPTCPTLPASPPITNCRYQPATVARPPPNRRCVNGIQTFAIQVNDCTNPFNGRYAVLAYGANAGLATTTGAIFFDYLHSGLPANFYLRDGSTGLLINADGSGTIFEIDPHYSANPITYSNPPLKAYALRCSLSRGILNCASAFDAGQNVLVACWQSGDIYGLVLGNKNSGSLPSWLSTGICYNVANLTAVPTCSTT